MPGDAWTISTAFHWMLQWPFILSGTGCPQFTSPLCSESSPYNYYSELGNNDTKYSLISQLATKLPIISVYNKNNGRGNVQCISCFHASMSFYELAWKCNQHFYFVSPGKSKLNPIWNSGLWTRSCLLHSSYSIISSLLPRQPPPWQVCPTQLPRPELPIGNENLILKRLSQHHTQVLTHVHTCIHMQNRKLHHQKG